MIASKSLKFKAVIYNTLKKKMPGGGLPGVWRLACEEGYCGKIRYAQSCLSQGSRLLRSMTDSILARAS